MSTERKRLRHANFAKCISHSSTVRGDILARDLSELPLKPNGVLRDQGGKLFCGLDRNSSSVAYPLFAKLAVVANYIGRPREISQPINTSTYGYVLRCDDASTPYCPLYSGWSDTQLVPSIHSPFPNRICAISGIRLEGPSHPLPPPPQPSHASPHGQTVPTLHPREGRHDDVGPSTPCGESVHRGERYSGMRTIRDDSPT